MGTTQSAEEIWQEHLSKMGTELAPLYSALYEGVVDIHVKWKQYQILFTHSAERVALLNDTAGFFFRVIQGVLFDDVILHIARLTDPVKSVGKPNLTTARLPLLVENCTAIATKIPELTLEAMTAADFARDLRNR